MEIKTLTTANFDKEVLQSDKPVVVDFWADWCGPCKMFAPIFHDAATELDGEVVFGKVNVDDANELAARFKVMSIPTVIVFKGGKGVRKSMGVLSKPDLMSLIQQSI